MTEDGFEKDDEWAGYRLVERLGQGGMATVWRAETTEQDTTRTVAIKILLPNIAANLDARGRFEGEAQLLKELMNERCDHIVKYYDHSVHNGTPYLVIEYLEGATLHDRLTSEHHLSPEEVQKIVEQLGAALKVLHRKKIIHRDLTSVNVFIARPEHTKLLDFGIAKIPHDSTTSHTVAGTKLGTPGYMSPEQSKQAEGIDFRADLWSLAVIAYQALTGSLPFDTKKFKELVDGHSYHPPSAIRALASLGGNIGQSLPPRVDEFFATAFAREPNERYSSVEDLVHALTLTLRGDDLPVRPVTDVLPPTAAAGLAGVVAPKLMLANGAEPSDPPDGRLAETSAAFGQGEVTAQQSEDSAGPMRGGSGQPDKKDATVGVPQGSRGEVEQQAGRKHGADEDPTRSRLPVSGTSGSRNRLVEQMLPGIAGGLVAAGIILALGRMGAAGPERAPTSGTAVAATGVHQAPVPDPSPIEAKFATTSSVGPAETVPPPGAPSVQPSAAPTMKVIGDVHGTKVAPTGSPSYTRPPAPTATTLPKPPKPKPDDRQPQAPKNRRNPNEQ